MQIPDLHGWSLLADCGPPFRDLPTINSPIVEIKGLPQGAGRERNDAVDRLGIEAVRVGSDGRMGAAGE
jgi:hypothetical protein